VTNDTLAPFRAMLRAPARATRSQRGRPKPRPGNLRRAGPSVATGRWSLVAPLLEPAPTPTEVAHARAMQLLDRHGVLTREGRPARVTGAYVVLLDGRLSAFLERGARSLLTFDAATSDGWIDGLVWIVKEARVRRLELLRIDGGPAVESAHAERLRQAGFVES